MQIDREGTYTSRFNRRHKLFGHLFSGRYKSLLVSGQGGYLRTVCEYVHLNPVRAKLLPVGEPLRSYRWSSFPEYLKAPSQRAAWLRVDRVLGACGIPKDSVAGRREFERVVETRRDRSRARRSRASDGAGAWGTSRSGRNCWSECRRRRGRSITGRNWRSRPQRVPSSSWRRNWPSAGGNRKT